ncbi:unnamed protein product [Absidia cylindrospora]
MENNKKSNQQNKNEPSKHQYSSSITSVPTQVQPPPLSEPLYQPSSSSSHTLPSSSLPAQWKSSAIPLNRREQVHRYVGHIPTFPSHSSSFNRRYELVIREQPQQCRMSGFGEKDRRPIDPAPIVQLLIFDDNKPIDLEEQQYPLCILHVSLWSEDRTHQLDTVQIINRRTHPSSTAASASTYPASTSPSSASTPSNAGSSPVRTMTGTLTSSPYVLRDQHEQLGIYFSFPDIGVRVAKMYCLRFDLVILADSSHMGESVSHIYSNPFITYSVKEFPGMKESSDLAKHLSRQGLKVSVRHSVRQKRKGINKADQD